MSALLEVNYLQISFTTENGSTTAVNDISFSVNRNEILGIAGESGSGKSVTALAILRLLSEKNARFENGSILFSPDGIHQYDLIKADKATLRSIRGKEIGMIFQEPMTSLNPVFTCGHQVIEAIRTHQQVSANEALDKTIRLFEKVKLPNPARIAKRYPHQLSGGQKQRVMIAMAMSGNPSLLICDEPTTALDVTVQKAVLDLIRELQHETKMGVIFITHDLGLIAEIARRVAVMYKGKMVEQGPVENVFRNPRDPYTRALLLCRPALYAKGQRLPVVGKAGITEKDEVRSGRPEDMEAKDPSLDTPSTPPSSLLTVRHLSVWFPNRRPLIGKPTSFVKAVDDVSFDVYKGETLGLVGESGCGKTTLGRALLRLIEPTSGTIRFEDSDMQLLSGNQLNRFRKHIQIIFQDPYSSLNPSITVGAAIAEPLKVHMPALTASMRQQKVEGLLEKVGLGKDHLNRYPHEFSGGQRQRIVIARALALEPTFIVCDESVSALDVSVQAQVLNLLNDLKKEFHFTSVFISHDLSVVRYMCDRIMVMKEGKIVESGMAEEIYRSPQTDYTRHLIEAIPSLPAEE